MMEICLVPSTHTASQYHGLYLFTTPSRFMRPVKNLLLGEIEYVGSFEQVYLHICITAEEAVQGVRFAIHYASLVVSVMVKGLN